MTHIRSADDKVPKSKNYRHMTARILSNEHHAWFMISSRLLKNFFTVVVITLSRSQSLSLKSSKTVLKGAQTRETNTKDRNDS